jgi:hypothetical protein
MAASNRFRENLETVDADAAIECRKRLLVACLAHDVVPRCDEMAGVETHAHARRAVQVVDDRGQMFEAVSESSSLARGVFKQHHRAPAWPCGKRVTDRRGDEPQRVLIAARRARAGMDDDAEEAERVGAIELVDESCD